MKSGSDKETYAGAGRGTIRFPEELFPIEGFCGVHDCPQVRVLVTRRGEQAALVCLELVMLPPELVELVKALVSRQTGTKTENIWVHTTHAITTPHAPHAPMGAGGVPLELSPEEKDALEKKAALYTRALTAAVTEAARGAALSLRPAALRAGVCESRVSVNRDVRTPFGWWIGRNPQGETDPTVWLLRFDDESGNPVASVMACGLKPCVIDNSQMAQRKRLVSSDISGLACRLVEQALNAPCLFLMGAAGDQVPLEQALLEEVGRDGKVETVDYGVEAGLDMVQRLGRQLASDVLPALRGTLRDTGTADIRLSQTRITWPGKARMPVLPRLTAEYIPEGTVTVEARLMTLGNVALVGLKPEINCVTGRQLRSVSPYQHTIVVSMVDGGQKYMPDAASYGRVTWEAQSAMLMPGAAEAWVDAVAARWKEQEGENKNGKP